MQDDFEEDTTDEITDEKPAPTKEINEVTIRSYPKTVLFYPTAFASLILAIFSWILPLTPLALDPNLLYSIQTLIGYFWFVIFGFNLFIITFEFTKGVVAIFVMLMLILLMVVAFIFQSTGMLIFISPVAFGLQFNWNSYLAFFFILSFIIFISWLSTRFYYFKFTPNEILYKKGLLGDVERFGTSNVSVHKEIRDLFEYLLFLSGRLTITIPGRKLAIVIDNVPKINTIEHKIMTLLRRIEIDID